MQNQWRRDLLSRKYTSELEKEIGKRVEVCGWVHEIRDLGGLVFILLRDREGILQVTLSKKTVNQHTFKKAKKVKRESVVRVVGFVKEEKKAPNGYELVPEFIEIINEAETPLPLDVTEKVSAELDTRLDHRFLDLRKPRVHAIFRIRHQMLQSIREFLVGEGFIEVNTPKIVSTATEGGTELFPISYFEKEAFLNQSPQLYKQVLMAAGFEKVFEIGPIFRAEEHNTVRHLNEVTSVDIEMSFADHKKVMEILEKLVIKVHEDLLEKCSKFVERSKVKLSIPEKPFERVTYDEVLETAEKKGESVPWGEDLPTAALKIIGEEMESYYFIVDWPTKSKPFYAMPYADSPEICKSFDLMNKHIEIASGAQRIHDYDLLVARIKESQLEPESFSFYLEAFRYRIPPHAGWGLGIERFLMAMLELKNIREATLFPRDRHRLVP